jgi:hypothetical protein
VLLEYFSNGLTIALAPEGCYITTLEFSFAKSQNLTFIYQRFDRIK